VRTRDYKFIQSPRSGMEKALPELAYRNTREQELYHLPSDPGEHDERSGKDARATATLRDQLEDAHRALREERARMGPLDNKIDQSEQLLQQLHQLGYPAARRSDGNDARDPHPRRRRAADVRRRAGSARLVVATGAPRAR
jgi:hypothetical protein